MRALTRSRTKISSEHGQLFPESLSAARRLAILSALLACAVAVVVVTDLALGVARGRPAAHSVLLAGTAASLVGASLVVFRLARSGAVPMATLLDVGLVFEVVAAFGIAVASYLRYPLALADHANVWLCLWIALFPLAAPSRPLKNLAAAILAASAAPLVLLLAARFGRTLPDPGRLALSILPYSVGVPLALIPRRFLEPTGRSSGAEERQLGSYRLVRVLARGGMGEVWEAEHARLDRRAAVKLVPVELLDGEDESAREDLLERFEIEARTTASLRSPHTVTLYDYGVASEPRTFYYAMELLSGLDLESLVNRFGPQPPARVVHILRQILESLAEAHSQGLVHRDIKPANIYLTRLGLEHDFVKVLDFGLVARPRSKRDRRLTEENMIVGTPAFMAPELAAGEHIDGRADLYAVGCVAYWLLTGTNVFEVADRTPMQILADHMTTAPESPSARLGRELPAWLEAIVLCCLAKDPEDRPSRAAELQAMLGAPRLDDPWTAEDARVWWELNLRELASPARTSAARATTVIRTRTAE